LVENNIESAIEAILFVAGDAVKIDDIAEAIGETKVTISSVADKMIEERKKKGSGIEVFRVGDKLQLTTSKKYEEYIKKLFMPDNTYVITNAAIETLSIIAYNQPVTRGEIEKIRGVSCTYSLNALLNKGLIYESGRKDTLGHPKLYKTSDEFLRHFGISNVEELPKLNAEDQ
jgi:segregation and condensation protein B